MDDLVQAITDPVATRVYLALITTPDIARDDLLASTGVPAAQLDRVIASLVAEGALVVRDNGTWHVPPPDVTLPARAAELERLALRIRSTADQLSMVYHESRRGRTADTAIEVLESAEDVRRVFREVISTARSTVRSLDRPPYKSAQTALPELQRQKMASGVVFSTVYDPDILAGDQLLAGLEILAAAGEQMRVLRGVPMKLILADEDCALISLEAYDRSYRGSLFVRRSPLLEGLITLYETLWRLAVPLPRAGADLDAVLDAEGHPVERDRQILLMLAGGATDETIARQLSLSTRTVERRVRSMLDRLGAETRFQAGVQAARRGWL